MAPIARAIGLPPSPDAGIAMRVREWIRRLADGVEDDLTRGAGAPLLVAAFAAGITLHFSLPREPWGPAVVAVAVAAVVGTLLARRRGRRAILGMILSALLLGAAVAVLATERAAAPRLDRERTVTVTGRVVDLDATAKGGVRLGVDVARMEAPGLVPEATPSRITATLPRGRSAPEVGEAVSFKARLKPPEGPVLPGGYDFARRAWFEGRGASGYVLGRARPADLGPPDLLGRIAAPIATLRHTIAERVRAALPGATGAIGAALMVGEQRAIPEAAAEPLRASGLTHIVSISGLHMSLVAGGVMVVLRFLFVAVPGFTLHHSAKKWAALAAFLAATGYLMLSGMQIAAVRSHLMVTIALLAVVVDRPAITMHTVAVAAVAILVLDPEQAMEPSFRMSFLAVIALVASWDLWQIRVAERPPPSRHAGPIGHALLGAWRHAEGLAFSSLVAGLATAPVIAGVFYRGAPYSILANMIVLPVVGMVVMPGAVVAALLMPFGLESLPLAVMGAGIDFMVEVGRRVSSLPGGAGLLGAPPAAAMPLGIVAVLWLSLWRSRIRLLGLVPAVLAVMSFAWVPKPDVLIGRHGTAVAVRGDDGRLHVLAERDDRFDVAIWLAADADPRSADDPSLKDGWRCDTLGCVFARDGEGDGARARPLSVALVRDPRGFPEDCGRVDVVVTRIAAPPGCGRGSEVFDRPRRAATGPVSLVLLDDPGSSTDPSRDVLDRRSAPLTVDPTRDETDEAVPNAPRQTAEAESTETQDARAGTNADTNADTRDRGVRSPKSEVLAPPISSGQHASASAEGRAAKTETALGQAIPTPVSGSSGPAPTAGRAVTSNPTPDRKQTSDPLPVRSVTRPAFEVTTTRSPQGRRWSPSDPLAERLARDARAIPADRDARSHSPLDGEEKEGGDDQ